MEWKGTRSESTSAASTIFGEIRVKRFGYGAEGADTHPLDAELNLPRERYSFAEADGGSRGVKGSVVRALAATLGRGWKAPSGGAGGSCGRGLRRLLWAARSTGGNRSASRCWRSRPRKRCDATQRPALKPPRRRRERLAATRQAADQGREAEPKADAFIREALRAPTRRRGSCAGTKHEHRCRPARQACLGEPSQRARASRKPNDELITEIGRAQAGCTMSSFVLDFIHVCE